MYVIVDEETFKCSKEDFDSMDSAKKELLVNPNYTSGNYAIMPSSVRNTIAIDKLDKSLSIECPHCKSKETKQSFKDERQYIYRCDGCFNDSIVDVLSVNDIQVNGINSVIEFVEN